MFREHTSSQERDGILSAEDEVLFEIAASRPRRKFDRSIFLFIAGLVAISMLAGFSCGLPNIVWSNRCQLTTADQ